MFYKINSNSDHCLFRELPSASTSIRPCQAAAAAHPLEFEVARCRTSQFQGVSCLLRFESGMTFPTLCLTPEGRIGSRVQSTVSCFSELYFL